MFYKFRKFYLCLIVVYAIVREVVPLNFLISSQYVSVGVFLLGGALVLWDLFCDKNVLKSKNIGWLFAFIFIYGISTIVNAKYGIIDNIKTIGILFIFFFTLYAYGEKHDKYDFENDLVTVFLTYNLTMGIFLILGIVMYFFDIGYEVSYFDASAQGFSKEYLRLWGLFTEANCAAVYSLVVLVSACWLYKKVNRTELKILLIINITNSFLFVVLTLSNTAKLVFLICILWMVFCIEWFKCKDEHIIKRAVILLFIPCICATLLFGVIKTTEKVLPYTKHMIQAFPMYETVQKNINKGFDYLYVDIGSIPVVSGLTSNDDDVINDSLNVEVLERPDKNNSDITHGRMDRWKESFKIYKMSPIVGVTARDVNSFARVNCPENIFAIYGINVHNSYLEVLVSTGIVGLAAFVVFFVLSVIAVIKVVFSRYSSTNIMLSTAMILVALAGFFHTDLFFIFRLGGVILWIILGYFALQASKLNEKEY